MMKRSLYVLSVLLTVTLMFSMLYSCNTSASVEKIKEEVRQEIERQAEIEYQKEQARLRRIYRPILETSSSQMLNELIINISPQSGRDPRVVVDLEDIYFDEKENLVAADVLLTWQARDFWSGVPYGECQVTGTLYVYMPIRSTDVTTAILQQISYNQHLRQVATNKDIADLNAGIRITVR